MGGDSNVALKSRKRGGKGQEKEEGSRERTGSSSSGSSSGPADNPALPEEGDLVLDDAAGEAALRGGAHARLFEVSGWPLKACLYWFGFHRASLRYVHRGWVVVVLLAWSTFMLVQDIREGLVTIAFAEFSSAGPFIFFYISMLHYFHGDHLSELVVATRENINKRNSKKGLVTIRRAINFRVAAMVVVTVVLTVSWQSILTWAINSQFKKTLEGELLGEETPLFPFARLGKSVCSLPSRH
jgi:hypothetical protein